MRYQQEAQQLRKESLMEVPDFNFSTNMPHKLIEVLSDIELYIFIPQRDTATDLIFNLLFLRRA